MSVPLVRVVTWNVADNTEMKAGFTNRAIDKVLGLDDAGALADIYAIGLQENVWECNKGSFHKIGGRFLERIKMKNSHYEVVHVEGTRESNFCALGSMLGTHGTTLLVVIAKKNLVKSHSDFHVNDHCSASFPENDEKGFASIMLHLLNGESVALAAAHLESSDSKIRRESFNYFFQDAYKNGWKSCNYQFIFGDFNVRTGENNSERYQDTKCISSNKIQVKSLRICDELTGINPYSTDPSWKGNILSYINKLQPSIFREGDLNFLPTYSTKPSDECNDHEMCYRANRPVSWTDRILYTKGEIVKYDSILEKYGDHYPVFGTYKLN